MLNTSSPYYCPPTIRKDAKICLIGEAPGDKEAYHKECFIGPAGRILRELCASVGINFRDCHVTNVIKYQPKSRNNVKEFIDLSKKEPQYFNNYLEHEEALRLELSQSKANVFVALGAVPLWALTRQKGITTRRGSIYESTLLPGKKVVACLHPSSCTYEGKYTNRYLINFDLSKALKESNFPELKFKPRTIHINPTFKEAKEYLLHILNSIKETSFDIELVLAQLNCFGFSLSPEETMCIALSRGSEHVFSFNEELEILSLTNRILSSKKIIKIMQNKIFDTAVMFNKYNMISHRVHDTMIGQAILCPDLPKGLDFLTSIYTDMPYFKDQSSKMWKGVSGSWDQFFRYNGKDTLSTHECWHRIQEDLHSQGNWITYLYQNLIVSPLIYMSERGYLMDHVGLRKASVDAAIKIAGDAGEYLTSIGKGTKYADVIWAEKQGYEVGGIWKQLWTMFKEPLNPNSSDQMKHYFYITKNLPPYKNRVKEGGRYKSVITVDKMALKRLSRKGHAEAELILDMRYISKRKSTYYDMKLSKDNRFRTSYNPVGGGGDRLSSSKRELDDEGTNAQNQPLETKPFMIADPDCILINIDIKQADNRVWANICPEPMMKEAFDDGVDVHALTGTGIFNMPIEDIIYEHENGINCDVGDGTKSRRFWAKKSNHSFNYGEGAEAFSLLMEIPISEAKRIRDGYLKMYPGVEQGWRWIRNDLYQIRTLYNCFNRKRIFLGELNAHTFNSAYSFIPRSTVVDCINRNGIIYAYYNKYFNDVELLGQVHDSITLQAPLRLNINKLYDIINNIRLSLETPIKWKDTTFVLPAEVSVGFDLKNQVEIDMLNRTEATCKIETIIKQGR